MLHSASRWFQPPALQRSSKGSTGTNNGVSSRCRDAQPAAPSATAAPAATTTVQRRACDVAVVGRSLQAYAAAYLLSRRGKRVVVIEGDLPSGSSGSGGSSAHSDELLHLPATEAHLVHEATEALALWRGIEAAAGSAELLQVCGTIDVAPTRGGSAASETLGRMQDACKEAGLQFAMLAPDEAAAALPSLRLPRRTAGLYVPLGGVLHGAAAAAALRALAQRAGASLLQPAGRRLLGWRDAGSHFALRTAPVVVAAPAFRGMAAATGLEEEETVFECEQLLLLPDAVQQQAQQQQQQQQQQQLVWLQSFGLELSGAALAAATAGRWQAQPELQQAPAWQLLGGLPGSSDAEDGRSSSGGDTVRSAWGLPLLNWAPVGQGVLLARAPEGPPTAAAAAAKAEGDAAPSADAAATAAAAANALLPELPLLEELAAADAAELQQQAAEAEAAAARARQQELEALGTAAVAAVRGIGGMLPGSRRMLQLLTTPDGEPVVGSHPGFEAGRVVVGLAAASPAACSSLDGRQLAPLLAQLAVAEVLGMAASGGGAAAAAAAGAVDWNRVALGREAVAAAVAPAACDTWEELVAWQQAQQVQQAQRSSHVRLPL